MFENLCILNALPRREDDDDKVVVWVSAEVEDAGAIWETITDEAHAMFDITSPLQIQVLM